ncbi:MAG: hypothetical protein JNK48_14840 [Bryobacterales bacterium]|nr:hypothetical protein [Bryobacterales bacterium]
MKTLFSSILVSALLAGSMLAASIDGKWKATSEAKSKKGKSATITTVFDLKSDGSALSGTVTTGKGRRDVTMDIKDGKIEGDRFTFTTVQQNKKKGEVKMQWSGSLAGEELKGSSSTGGKRKGTEFTAKRM